MNMLAKDTIDEQLEEYIDHIGLFAVLEKLEAICYGKAEHMRSNWQDDLSAKAWERMGKALNRVASTASKSAWTI